MDNGNDGGHWGNVQLETKLSFRTKTRLLPELLVQDHSYNVTGAQGLQVANGRKREKETKVIRKDMDHGALGVKRPIVRYWSGRRQRRYWSKGTNWLLRGYRRHQVCVGPKRVMQEMTGAAGANGTDG